MFSKIFIELKRNNDADLLCLHLACTMDFCHGYIMPWNTHELSAADGGASQLPLFTVGLMTTDD